MRKNSIRERAKRVPPEIKSMVRRSMAISTLISKILDRKGLSQKDLADTLGKSESEVSKWLRGTHNFTLKTIAKIESILGEPLIYTAEEANQEIYILKHEEGKESVISYPATYKSKYTEFKKGKTLDIQISASVTKNDTVTTLNECQAN